MLRRSIDMVHDDERPSEVLTDDIMRGAKGKPVRPKTAGQKRYIDAIRENVDHLRPRSGRHGQELAGRGHGGAGAAEPSRCSASSSPVRRSRPVSGSASFPATSWPRSIRTCVRSTTRCTTWSSPRARRRCSNARRSRSRRSRSCAAARSTAASSSSTRRRTRRPSR